MPQSSPVDPRAACWRGLLRLATCAMLAAAGSPSAQPQTEVSESDYLLEDIPVVLSPARLAQPLTEAPAAVTVIDREMIDTSGARQIADLFRLVPGFTVAYHHGYAPSVTYHGFADEFARRMQVLIDGRSVYLPSIGGTDWSSLPITLDDIERIEVIRGPANASHGANAFLAVISITTRHAIVGKGAALHIRNGEHRIHDGIARFGAGSRGLAYRMTLGYQQDDGFNNRFDTHHTRLFNTRIEYQLGVSDHLEAQLGVSDSPREIGFNGDDTDPPRSKGVASHFQQLRWLHNVDPSQDVSLQFYHNYHNTSDDFSSLPIDLGPYGTVQLPLNLNIKAERYDLELQHTLAPRQNLRLVWGGSARQDLVTAPDFFGNDRVHKSNLSRLFANVEWRMQPALVTNFAALYEYNDITGGHVAPRLAANLHVDDRQTLRAVISTATRTPTLFEHQGNWKFTLGPIVDQLFEGNRALDSENILSRELGYMFVWPERGTALDVKVYYDKLTDLIRADEICSVSTDECLQDTDNNTAGDNFDGNYKRFLNTESADARGLETQLNQSIGTTTRLVIGYAYTRISGDSAYYPRARSAPVNNLHALLIQRLPKDTVASMAYYQTSAMEYLGSGNYTERQRRLDLRLARTFKRTADTFKVAVVAQNLLDPYQDFLYQLDTPTKVRTRNLFDTRAFIELEWILP